MRLSAATALALALGVILIGPTAKAMEDAPVSHHHRHHHKGHAAPHAVETPSAQHRAPAAAEPNGPSLKPYAHPGDGDNDGLSRDPDDCNKGCIGDNPG